MSLQPREEATRRNPGAFLGSTFTIWMMMLVLAGYLSDEGVEQRLLFAVGLSVLFASVAAILFSGVFRLAQKDIGHKRDQVEEGGYCPWAYAGGLAITIAVFGLGLALAFSLYGGMPQMWVVVLLLGNCGVIGVTWWTHLVITERSWPCIPDKGPGRGLALKALEMESKFLRTIIATLTQAFYLIGAGLLGAGSLILTRVTDGPANSGTVQGNSAPDNWIWIVIGLGVWVLGLHLGMTSPFMRRYGMITRAYREKAREDQRRTASRQVRPPSPPREP